MRLDLKNGRVELLHGAGGRAMTELVADLFHRALDNPALGRGHDAALLPRPEGRVVMSTDGYVISPLFFPGGDIGAMAVHGTVNDLAMAGGQPLALTAGFILEEGLPLADLSRIVGSMASAAREAGVQVVAGDTKVVERGKADGVFITTAGLGVVADGIEIAGDRARPGDAVIVSGTLGDHGVAVMSKRENMSFGTEILSDSQPLNDLVAAMLAAVPELAVLRDPTRGGLAAALNEIAAQSGVAIALEEAALPVRPAVASACELLGLEPLNIANEGKLVAICPPERADALLQAMRAHPRGREAAVIGTVRAAPKGVVYMRTGLGGNRIVDWIAGEQLPRIC